MLDVDKDKDDSRKPQIKKIKDFCKKETNWFIVQSNPCFEVWLYYHNASIKPVIDKIEFCSSWKKLVNNSIEGGLTLENTHFLLKRQHRMQRMYLMILMGLMLLVVQRSSGYQKSIE